MNVLVVQAKKGAFYRLSCIHAFLAKTTYVRDLVILVRPILQAKFVKNIETTCLEILIDEFYCRLEEF